MSVHRLFGAIGAALLLSSPLIANATALPFRPIHGAYSPTLDRWIFTAADPASIHVYNPANGADSVIPLASVPASLSVSSDGAKAVVAHDHLVSYIDLASAAVIRTYAIPFNGDQIVLGDGYAYISAKLSNDGIVCLNLNSGVVVVSSYPFNFFHEAHYSPTTKSIYNNHSKIDVTAGILSSLDSLTLTAVDPPVCWTLGVSRDWGRVYKNCGVIRRASDLGYVGAVPGASPQVHLMAFSDSAAGQLATILGGYEYAGVGVPNDNEIRVYDTAFYKLLRTIMIPNVTVGGTAYAVHGGWVAFNSAGTTLYAVAQVDAAAGVSTSDFIAYDFPMVDANPCSPAFSPSTATVAGSGSLETVGVVAAQDCAYSAVSDAPWITLIAGQQGSGSGTLTFIARPNPTTTPRTGTIRLGAAMFTLQQDGAPSGPAANIRIPSGIVDARYSRALDKLIFVSATPQEMHLYDPATNADQIVPLPSLPLSLSLSPDGLQAAVGTDGHVALVDLQTRSIDASFAVPLKVDEVVLPGNGYVYVFTDGPGMAYSLSISSRVATPITNWLSSTGRVAARLDPSGKYVHVGGPDRPPFRVDISSGIAVRIPRRQEYSLWSDAWILERGERLISSFARIHELTPTSTDDYPVVGSLSNTVSAMWGDDSQAVHSFAVITNDNPENDGYLQVYDDASFTHNGTLTLAPIVVDGASYPAHGRFIFWNRDADKLVILEEITGGIRPLSPWALALIAVPSSGCGVELSKQSVTFGYEGGDDRVSYPAPDNCVWTPTSDSPWISIRSGRFIIGSGSFSYTVMPNPGTAARTAVIRVADRSLTITQPGSPGLSSYSAHIASTPASGTIGVIAAPGTVWTATPNTAWITLTPGVVGGVGSGTVLWLTVANPGPAARVGTITVATQVFTITQDGTGPASNGGFLFTPVTPCRIVDTRGETGQTGSFGPPVMATNTSRSFPLPTGNCGVPLSAKAYSLNVTVVPSEPLSYLTIWPTGKPQPFVSTLNSLDGRIVANAAIVPAGDSGAISVYVTNKTHVVIDVNGYFDTNSPAGLAFFSTNPCRIVDTRSPAGPFGGPAMLPQTNRVFGVVNGACSVPSAARAFALNVTVVPHENLPYLTIWPSDRPQPFVSTLNSIDGGILANAAITPASTSGAVSVFATGKTEVLLDSTGYFAPAQQSTGLHFYPLSPCRVVDTRGETGQTGFFGPPRLASGVSRTFPLASGNCGVPTQAVAVSLNVTVVPKTSRLGYLTLWPAGQAQPLVSTLNSVAGRIVSNAAIVPTGTGASVAAFATDDAELILDVNGYFAP